MKKIISTIVLAAITSLSHAQIVSIPDANFKQALLSHSPVIDVNNNGQIETTEAQAVTSLGVAEKNIVDMTGIEAFTSLKALYCYANNIKTLSLTKNTQLTTVTCSDNALTQLDISKNTQLSALYCHGNALKTLNLSNNRRLGTLRCSFNQLTSLNVSNNRQIRSLDIEKNQLTTIDVSQNVFLRKLICGMNKLTTINVSANPELIMLLCNSNLLSTLSIANNTKLLDLNTSLNPNLTSICVGTIVPRSNWSIDAHTSYVTNCGTTAARVTSEEASSISVVQGQLSELSVVGLSKGTYTLQVYNTLGQSVYKAENITHTHTIGNELPAGHYMIKIAGKNLAKTIQVVKF